MADGDIYTWKYLIAKYLDNSITEQELELLLHKVEHEEEPEALTELLKSYWYEAVNKGDHSTKWERDTKFEEMMAGLKAKTPKASWQFRKVARLAAAVFFVMMLGPAVYFLFSGNDKQKIAYTSTQEQRSKKNVLSNTGGAVLTLSSGQQIVLDSLHDGTLAIQENAKIISKSGQIIYNDQVSSPDSLSYNTLSTAKGKQYQLILSDGSKVWLNAVSSIRYPVAFTEKERTVEITGEAYFEIAKNAERPFRVFANGVEVQVLGTHFNVNAYGDEAMVQTTLLEGSVKIIKENNIQVLKPGQQAQIHSSSSENGEIKVLKDVNLDAVMAWKNGYFFFDQTSLAMVMRQIARWYDVEIVYDGNVPDRKFGGEIAHNTNISEVVEILKESKVHCRLEDKKIVMLP